LLQFTRFLSLIEALFTRKVKEIPAQNCDARFLSKSIIIVILVCYNLSKLKSSKEGLSYEP
jgi:hypothetical protein